MSKQKPSNDDRYRLTWTGSDGSKQQGTGRLTLAQVKAWLDWAAKNEPNTLHWAEKDGQK